MRRRILEKRDMVVVRPHVEMTGGINSLWDALAPLCSQNVEFVCIGISGERKSKCREAIRRVADCARWLLYLLTRRPRVVVLNTSMKWLMLSRDTLYAALARLVNAQIILFIHGWDEECFQGVSKSWSYRVIIRHVFRKKTSCVVLCADFREKLLTLLPSVKAVVARVAIAREFQDERTLNSSERSIVPTRLLFISRIVESKGIPECLSAVNILQQQGVAVELVIAGDGPYLQRAKELAIAYGVDKAVRFVGRVVGAEKVALYDKCNILVIPTGLGEGFPLVIAEAMSRYMPVITTSSGAIGEIMKDRVNALLVPCNDAKAVAQSVLELINNSELRNEMIRRNREIASKEFTAASLLAIVVECVVDGEIRNRVCLSG